MDECFVIDDVDAALARMTECGRSIVEAAAHDVRDAVLSFAAKRRWTVIRYEAFVEWVLTSTRDQSTAWLVLDPLFPRELLGPRMLAFRATRTGASGRMVGDADLPELLPGMVAGLLDDAAATGGTALFVARSMQAAGVPPARFNFCVSNAVARGRVLSAFPQAVWQDCFPGSWTIMHLRDGCPYLPYSGRRWAALPHGDSQTSHSAPLEARMPGTHVVGSVWQTLGAVRPIVNAVRHARADIIRLFGEQLNRPPLVADLPLLGAGVPALAMSESQVTKESLLASLPVD